MKERLVNYRGHYYTLSNGHTDTREDFEFLSITWGKMEEYGDYYRKLLDDGKAIQLHSEFTVLG